MYHECNVIDLPAFYGGLNVGRKGGGTMSELAKWMINDPNGYLEWLYSNRNGNEENDFGSAAH